MPDPGVILFNGDPAVAPGSVGTQAMNAALTATGGLDVSCWSQLVLYPRLGTLAANSITWQIEWSRDDATYHPIQVIRPTVSPDVDPISYQVQYTTADTAAAPKPALIVPVVGSFVRVRATRVGGAGSVFVVRAELGGKLAAEGLGA